MAYTITAIVPAPAGLRAVFHAAGHPPYSRPAVGLAVVARTGAHAHGRDVVPLVATPYGVVPADELDAYVGPWLVGDTTAADPLPTALANREFALTPTKE